MMSRSMMHGQLACLLFILGTSCYLQTVLGCNFPDFIQHGQDRQWRTMIRNQGINFGQKIKVINDRLEATPIGDSSDKEYVRVCMQTYDGNKLLVSHIEQNPTLIRFVCIKIVQRSRGIWQIKESSYGKELSKELCEEQLKTNEWLIMDTEKVLKQHSECGLQGGFDITVFDKSMMQSYCASNQGETRLESHCSTGSDIVFYFRKQTCVPNSLYMYSTQKVYCLAKWIDGNDQFVLIKSDRYPSMWVYSFPVDHGSYFHSYLHLDLRAPVGGVGEMVNYIMISMIQGLEFTWDHVCKDDYDLCENLPCGYDSSFPLTCPRSCGLCNSKNPSECQLPASLQGHWSHAAADGDHSVLVNKSMLGINGMDTLRCVDWNTNLNLETNEISDAQNLKHYMFVAHSHPGCRVRFSCAKVRESSAVTFLQLSQERIWPLITDSSDPIDCRDFNFNSAISSDTIEENLFRSDKVQILYKSNFTSSRTLNLEAFQYIEGTFVNDANCYGSLLQPDTKNSLRLDFPDCTHFQAELKDNFLFLDYLEYPGSRDMLLVTRTQNSAGSIHCWLFPRHNDNMIQLLDVADCNESAQRRIRNGKTRPVITIVQSSNLVRTKGMTSRKLPVTTQENGGSLLSTIFNRTQFNVTSGTGTLSHSNPPPHTPAITTIIGVLNRTLSGNNVPSPPPSLQPNTAIPSDMTSSKPSTTPSTVPFNNITVETVGQKRLSKSEILMITSLSMTVLAAGFMTICTCS